MSDFLLAGFFAKGEDWQNSGNVKLKSAMSIGEWNAWQHSSYIAPFGNTASRWDVPAVLLHDGISKEAQMAYQWVQMVQTERQGAWTNGEFRFTAFRDYLRDAVDAKSRVWMIDACDVAFGVHPFQWWDSLPIKDDVILVGEEHSDYSSQWFADGFGTLPKKFDIRPEFQRLRPLNCGVMAARVDVAVELLTEMVDTMAEMKRDATGKAIFDMFALAYVLLQEKWRGRVATFRMNGDFPLSTPGVHLRHFVAPVVHDRDASMKMVGCHG